MERREFIWKSTLGTGALMLPGLISSCGRKHDKKLGVALVGLGEYSTGQLAPALQQTTNCYLAAIVSGTESKRNSWSDQYDIPSTNVYSYETFDQIKDNKDIDIVYVVLPNALHKEYVVRAAQAGKHVICEKPMGISSQECREMIDACEKNGVLLSVGYRLHFDNYHQYLMNLGNRSAIRNIQADFGYVIKDREEWRMKKKLAGGGALMNVGIYCLQSACYVSQQLPDRVTAQSFKSKPEFFSEVEETIAFQFSFPNSIPNSFSTSHNMRADRVFVDTHNEKFELSPAFSYSDLGRNFQSKNFAGVNQQALQMDDFCRCIKEGRKSRVSGEMGLRDLLIIEAIYEASERGESVEIIYS